MNLLENLINELLVDEKHEQTASFESKSTCRQQHVEVKARTDSCVWKKLQAFETAQMKYLCVCVTVCKKIFDKHHVLKQFVCV